jgi:hypothetical protein
MTYRALRSRLFSSLSTASLMRSERFSPSSRAESMRSSVPSGNRAGVCSWLIWGRPRLAMTRTLDDITNCYKPYFYRYHLLPSSYFMISSIHQMGDGI